MPYDKRRPYSSTRYDRQVHVWRAPDGGANKLQHVYFARRYTYETDADGRDIVTLEGPGLNDLLARRIIAYYSGTAQAQMSGAADDLIKEFARDQLAGDADTDYDGVAITTRSLAAKGFTIQGDNTLGPSISYAAPWGNLLDVCQGIQDASRAAGTEVFFGVISTSPTTFQLITKVGQWGNDRTISGGNPVRFGKTWGNVQQPTTVDDAVDELNFVYGGGSGIGEPRVIQEVSNTDAINVSRYNRREGFAPVPYVIADGANEAAEVTAAANARMNERRARTTFKASLLDTPDTPFGGMLGWGFGDKLTVNHLDRQFDVINRSLTITVDGSGERFDSRVESV